MGCIENLIPLRTEPSIRKKYTSGSAFQNFGQYPCSGSNVTFQTFFPGTHIYFPIFKQQTIGKLLLLRQLGFRFNFRIQPLCLFIQFPISSFPFAKGGGMVWWMSNLRHRGRKKKVILIHSSVAGMWRSYWLSYASFPHPYNVDSNFKITSL